MGKYNTKQRKLFIEYLSAHTDELMTAKDIANALSDDKISVSAVYRNLAELEAEGKIRKSGKAGDRSVYYQYTGSKKCTECLHLNCIKCGNAFHLNRELSEFIIKGLKATERFSLDRTNTVLSGVCKACSR